MVEQFNEIYRRHPRYYGESVPVGFRQFLSGRALELWNCLDLGAGQGRYALHLARAGARVRAVDFSPVAMAQLALDAEAEDLQLTTEVADLCRYDFPVGEYDLIVGATVLDHLHDPCIQGVAAAVVGALKPGGTMYCEVFTTDDPGCSCLSEQVASETAGPVLHYFAAGELRRLFQGLETLVYHEGGKHDKAHGRPHWHGLALMIGVKGGAE